MIWTLITASSSNDNNHYTTSAALSLSLSLSLSLYIYIYIYMLELSWLENLANTYAWHTEHWTAVSTETLPLITPTWEEVAPEMAVTSVVNTYLQDTLGQVVANCRHD